MFEFHYCVDLTIIHPSVDPKIIPQEIASLRPKKESMAGAEIIMKGKGLGRNALLSVWSVPLHEPELLYSGTQPISEFIVDALWKLQCHCELFRRLCQDGQVFLRIGWWGDTNASAANLDAAALRMCGELGVGIELNFYPADENE